MACSGLCLNCQLNMTGNEQPLCWIAWSVRAGHHWWALWLERFFARDKIWSPQVEHCRSAKDLKGSRPAILSENSSRRTRLKSSLGWRSARPAALIMMACLYRLISCEFEAHKNSVTVGRYESQCNFWHPTFCLSCLFFFRSATMTNSDKSFHLEWRDNSSKPTLKRVSLPSAINPLFEEIHRDKKLLDIICDLVSHVLYPISK